MEESRQAVKAEDQDKGVNIAEELLPDAKDVDVESDRERPGDKPNNSDEKAEGSMKIISEGNESEIDHQNDPAIATGTACLESACGTGSGTEEKGSASSTDDSSNKDTESPQPVHDSDTNSSGKTSSEESPSNETAKDQECLALVPSVPDTSQQTDQPGELDLSKPPEPKNPLKEDDSSADGPTKKCTDQNSKEVVTNIKVLTTPPQDESDDIKVVSSSESARDHLDEILKTKENVKLYPTYTKSSNLSAKPTSKTEVNLPEQYAELESSPPVHDASNQSLPSSKPMPSNNQQSSIVEDKVNNNVQKCDISCQDSKSGDVLSDLSPGASSELFPMTSPVEGEPEKEQKPSGQALGKESKATSNNQDRSMLLQYLGLQPVQEGEKTNSKGPKDVAVMKPRLAFSFVDSFGPMPGLDYMNPADKVPISYNTSPFEAYSEGSHSPEPPILAETPVVGSSPPHHDYDAMEARMLDMTPRSNSQMNKRDLLSSFPSSDPASQDTKSAFHRKQNAVSDYLPSHSLENLCYRLAERVEPDDSRQDDNEKNLTRAESKKSSSPVDVVPCPRCHRIFKNRNQLRGHLRWHINDPINLLSGRWQGDRASSKPISSKSQTKSKLKGHVKVDRQGAGAQTNSGETLESFYCKLCPKVFRTSLKLRGHMMVHKRKQPRKKGPYWRNKSSKGTGSTGGTVAYQCDICSKVFGSKMKLSAHTTSHANEVHPRSKGVKRIGSLVSNVMEDKDCSSQAQGTAAGIKQKVGFGRRKGSFKCDICFKMFLSLRALNGHKGIHSSKWKLANSLHHVGRPIKVEHSSEESNTSHHDKEPSPSGTILGDDCPPEIKKGEKGELSRGADKSKTEMPAKSLNHRMPRTFFKCSICHLVFASRHRVRKHLFKVHSISPPGSESFSEEKVEGCMFCEVFKEPKRGRPKRGENTLMKCTHGKIVVGYNLPINVIRLNRKSRLATKGLSTSEDTTVSPKDVMQQKCTVKLSPVEVKVTEENINDQPEDPVPSSEAKLVTTPSLKRRGRPPKNFLKPLFAVQTARKNVYSVGAVKTHRHNVSSFRRRGRTGKEMTILGRQLKSGWDPKRQRFIGRPYKCHLCKMSYRSERQLCSHMRSHGINVFDLSQLPADQREKRFMANGDMDSKLNEKSESELHDVFQGLDSAEGISTNTVSIDTVKSSERKSSESGVGGICAVCSKEFDSDNMFHQHLLGRYNKKCRQEWMKQTYGFGMRSKVTSAPEKDEVPDNSPSSMSLDPTGQSNGNMYVIDKISMESFQGSGVFTKLQQNVNRKIEAVLQEVKPSSSCDKSPNQEDIKDVKQLPLLNTTCADMVSPKKGAVLDAVISRLTQSSKTSDSITDTVASASAQSNIPRGKKRKASNKDLFKCNYCAKAFDKKQKLSVHALIHRSKGATVMDLVENANQRNVSSISMLSNGDELQHSVTGEVGRSDDADALPPLQAIFSCTECPKQFTSNLKLAGHLKMHMKSTKSRGPCQESHSTEKTLEANQKPILLVKDVLEQAVPSRLPSDIGPDSKIHDMDKDLLVDSENAFETRDSSASDELKEVKNANVCEPTEVEEASTIENQNLQDISEKSESEVKGALETELPESNMNSTTNRPRILLKIKSASLQRFYDCPECQKSFKSRRHLTNHRRLHSAHEQSTKQRDALPLDVEQSNLVSQTFDSSEINSPGDDHLKDLSDSQSENVYANSEQPNTEYVAHTDERRLSEILYKEMCVACKICDKVMKKSQLGGHMKSHTKGLLSRFPTALQGSTNKTQLAGLYSPKIIPAANVCLESSVSPKSGGGNASEQSLSKTENEKTRIPSDTELADAAFSVNEMNSLEGEIQSTYPKGKKFTCHICNSHFDFYQQLCQHLKVHVVTSSSFDGHTAPENMTNGSALSDNVSQEQAPYVQRFDQTFMQPKMYPCELCGFSFSSFRQFRVHISQTHGGKYQYRLMIQQKEAAKAGAFLKEPETINKTHPHKCDVCGRRFKRLALLIFHLNKLHKGWKQRLCMMNVRSRPRPPTAAIQNLPGTNATSSPGTAAPGSDDLPFTCELCGKSFRMKVQLCGHMKTHGRVGHSPIKISPLTMKGKYTLRKSRKPDFRLSDDWILDMDDEQMAFDHAQAMQQMPPRPTLMEQQLNNVKEVPDSTLYASVYNAKPSPGNVTGLKERVSGLTGHGEQYRMPVSSPELQVAPQAVDLKIPGAPPPPEPSKFITIQMEPVLQQMLHRCLLCHSYFSSQENAILHCKEVHFKKKIRHLLSNEALQGPAHPLGQHIPPIRVASGIRAPSQISPGIRPPRPQVSPSIQPPTPQLFPSARLPVPQLTPGIRPPTTRVEPSSRSTTMERMNSPPSRIQMSRQSASHPLTGAVQKSKVNESPTSTPSAKTISQTPFNEMLYRVEMSDGQPRYVCNTCKSTFLHYNFLMSHLADHNHLAYTCLQCGYATYSEKDYQLHCQLHDGQISKKIRRVRPKPPGYASQSEEKNRAPRAVATCHICQRSFVNMKGLKAHMVLHSANFSSISERRNESKRVHRKPVVGPLPCFSDANPEPLALVKPSEEQTEALDLSVKPVMETPHDEVLDLSMNSRSLSQKAESPVQQTPLDMAMDTIPEESQVVSLPDVCQVLQKTDVPSEEEPSPAPPHVEKSPHVRKPKNSIRLVGAIDVDVASLENKYSVVTDLLDTDSDLSPDLPALQPGQESSSGTGEGDGENDGKSPKKFRNYKCSMCQYATDFKDSMERHEQKHRKFRTLACHQCSYRTPEKRLMLRHVLTIHEKQKPYECKLCSYSSAYKHHLKRHHTKRHQRPLLTCAQCEFTTEDATKLEEHNATHPEPKVYKCKLCPMVFNSSKLFKAHKQIVHNKKKKSKKSSRGRSRSSSGVGDSSESTDVTSKEALAQPESLEPVVLKHPCNLCKYQTDDHNELTKHLMKKHFGSQTKQGLGDVCTTAQCPQCGYLTGKDQLKAHMMIHDIEELFNCDQCLFKACTQEELDTHVQEKHKVKLATTLVCKMCSMHFWDAEDMKQHTEMHLKDSTISIRNPFLCNMCPLKLMNRRDALRHIQLHTDRYPYKCRHCVFSCFTKASIQRHLSIHKHSTKSKPLLVVRKTSRKSLSNTGERNLGLENGRRKNHTTTC